MQQRKFPDLVDQMNAPVKPPYPYAPGQTKGGDTSEAAQARASKNSINDAMRSDVMDKFRQYAALSAEGMAGLISPKWRIRYQNEGDFLQDVRRRCSELVKLGTVIDSGEREQSLKNPRASIRMWKINSR